MRGHGTANNLGDRLDALAAGRNRPHRAEVKAPPGHGHCPSSPSSLGYEGENRTQDRFSLGAAWRTLVKKVRAEARLEESAEKN